MDVSIIIVNYNTKILILDCIKSIYEKTQGINFEIIVSDNGSTDGSIEMLKKEFPNVILLENKENLGFGKANNRGLKIARGKYILYLNSDTVLLNNAVKIFFDYWENAENNEEIGALGCNLYDENSKIIHSYGNFADYKLSLKQLFIMLISNFILSVFYIFHIPVRKFSTKSNSSFFVGEVDYVTGADLFLKNDENAFFDEYFFLYFEEADLQFNLKLKNKKRILIKDAKIAHFCGGSVGSDFSIKRKASFSRIQFELSRVKFLKKRYNNKISLFFVKFLISLIWLNPFLLNTSKKYLKTLWEI